MSPISAESCSDSSTPKRAITLDTMATRRSELYTCPMIAVASKLVKQERKSVGLLWVIHDRWIQYPCRSNVHCYSNSDIIVRRSQVTRRGQQQTSHQTKRIFRRRRETVMQRSLKGRHAAVAAAFRSAL